MSQKITPSELTPEMTLVGPRDTAAILQTTEGTLAQWRHTKAVPLPFVKLGAKVLYRLSDIKKFIEAQIQSGTSEPASPQAKRRAS